MHVGYSVIVLEIVMFLVFSMVTVVQRTCRYCNRYLVKVYSSTKYPRQTLIR